MPWCENRGNCQTFPHHHHITSQMVFFVCEGCNESLKKNQVDKHASMCRSCWAVTCGICHACPTPHAPLLQLLTRMCFIFYYSHLYAQKVDCNVTFPEDTYRAHTSCVSEAQRYEGKLYRAPKDKKKKNPQEVWNEIIETAVEEVVKAPPHLQSFVNNLGSYGNVPRNQKKFTNFAKNSLNVRNDKTIDELWGYLSTLQEEYKTANAEAPVQPTQQKTQQQQQKPKEEEIQPKKESKKNKREDGSDVVEIQNKEPKKKAKITTTSEEKGKAANKDKEEISVDWVKKVKKILKSSTVPLTIKAIRKGVTGVEGVNKEDVKSMIKSTLSDHSDIFIKLGAGGDATYTYKKSS
jgi:cell growth-regulating nucleolar protein